MSEHFGFFDKRVPVEMLGTSGYIAPELRRIESSLTSLNFTQLVKADCYSLGKVLLALFIVKSRDDYTSMNFQFTHEGNKRFSKIDFYDQENELISNFMGLTKNMLTDKQRNLVNGLTQADPDKRISLDDALHIMEGN